MLHQHLAFSSNSKAHGRSPSESRCWEQTAWPLDMTWATQELCVPQQGHCLLRASHPPLADKQEHNLPTPSLLPGGHLYTCTVPRHCASRTGHFSPRPRWPALRTPPAQPMPGRPAHNIAHTAALHKSVCSTCPRPPQTPTPQRPSRFGQDKGQNHHFSLISHAGLSPGLGVSLEPENAPAAVPREPQLTQAGDCLCEKLHSSGPAQS